MPQVTLVPTRVLWELAEAGNKCGCASARQCCGNVPAGTRTRSQSTAGPSFPHHRKPVLHALPLVPSIFSPVSPLSVASCTPESPALSECNR